MEDSWADTAPVMVSGIGSGIHENSHFFISLYFKAYCKVEWQCIFSKYPDMLRTEV